MAAEGSVYTPFVYMLIIGMIVAGAANTIGKKNKKKLTFKSTP